MKTLVKSISVLIPALVAGFRKLNDHLIKPLKTGFLGFTTFLMIIFFIHLLYFVLGFNEKFGMDILDILLAGYGFLLKMTGALIKSFVK